MIQDVTYPLFPTFAFLGFVLSLIPLPWHLQAWNSGTCFFMIWTSLACLNQFVNSIVWAGNALNPAPWWCEISIRILMGASVGIPASSLCIVRRLYTIASVQAVTVSPAEKRRAVLIDSLICVLFPMIYIALQYVVQGHRFNIFEDIGCYPALYNTLLTYFISFMWPVVLGLISAVYCGLALWEFNKRRIQFSNFLNSHTSLTLSRYFRLMALAMTEMLSTTPLAIFVIYLNATTSEVGPWRSWEDTHFDYHRVEQIPGMFWRMNHQLVVSMELTRWLAPFGAIVFFGFFGFAQEAQKNYRAAYTYVAKRLKFLPLPRSSSTKISSTKRTLTLGSKSSDYDTTLPCYSSPSKVQEKLPYSSMGSTFSDHASMTDVSSKYYTEDPLSPASVNSYTPTADNHPITPTTSTTVNNDREDSWNLPSSRNIALTTISVSLPSNSETRRLTI
uniref:Pheromone receptor n=1 Tax=Agrocybe salicacicola TaxID=1078488 RepID=A0A2P0M843_9AGAR|nr:pheromone receptor [Agrocybe salicacicola]